MIGAFAFGFWLRGKDAPERIIAPPVQQPVQEPVQEVIEPTPDRPPEINVDLSPPDFYKRREEIFNEERKRLRQNMLS